MGVIVHPFRFVLLALAFVMLACLASPFPVLADTLTAEEIARRLEEAAALLEEGDQTGARRLLASLDGVRLAGGDEMALESAVWERLVEQNPGDAPAHLRAAAASLRAPQTELPPDARARLERILSRPEFRPVPPSLWERLVRWLVQQLALLERVPGLATVGDLLTWTIALFSGVIVGAVLLIFIRGLRRNVVVEEEARILPGAIPTDAGEAQEYAAEAAKAGNFREAMRLLYLAALLHLDEVGLIRFDRALTNREVLATLSGSSMLHSLLAPVVGQFDRVWYGHAPFGQTEYEVVQRQIEALRAVPPPR
ncbi:MAG: DUF4129 domain-containing protein [Ardenticatenaceae bacterium]